MKPVPPVLGLDLSTRRTGVAFPDGRAYAWEMPDRWHVGQKLHCLHGYIARAIQRFAPRLVVAEKAIPTSSGALSALSKAHAMLDLAVYEAAVDVAVVLVHPTTLKRYATGRGNADKAAMVAAARAAGAVVAGDDEADAWLLRALGVAGLGGPDLLDGADPGHRLEVVAAHTWPVTR